MKKFFSLLVAVLCVWTAGAAISEFPFKEGFENVGNGSIPNGWTRLSSNAYPQVAEYTALAYSGDKYLRFYAGSGEQQVLVLPAFEEPLANLTLQFYQNSYMYLSASYGQLEVGYVTDATDASTFVSMLTLDRESEYTKVVLDYKDAPAEAANIAFRLVGASSYGSIYVDEVKVQRTADMTDDPDGPNPDDDVVQEVWLMEAAPLILPKDDPDYREGKYVWIIVFGTGTKNGSGRPAPWFAIYTDKETAISGNYSKTLGNMAIGEQVTFMDMNGTANGLITADDAELNLTFEGYHGGYQAQGYRYGIYSGSYSMTCGSKRYVAQFTNMFCNSQSYESMIGQAPQDHISMWDEEDFPESFGNVNQKSEITNHKQLIDGQLVIIRDGVKYNAQGAVIR